MAFRLSKQLTSPISTQYIHRNYHIVKQADMVLAFTCFSPDKKQCLGGTGWGVEMAKVLQKPLYVYDVERNRWFWYESSYDVFYACNGMSEEQILIPTLVKKTAIIGLRNIYDYPDALSELQETFKRSLHVTKKENDSTVESLCKTFQCLSFA